MRDERLVAGTLAVLVEDQAPGRGLADGGGFHQITLRPLVTGELGEREIRHVGPRALEFVARLHRDRLELLVLGEPIVFPVVAAHDVGVDDRRGFFHVDERLAERLEIGRPRSPDALPGEVVAPGRRSPVNEVAPALRVPDRLGRPGATGVVGRDLDQARRGPVHEVRRIPDHQRPAAGLDGAVPIAVAVDREVGGNEVKRLAVGRTQQERVAHALFADLADERGLAVVERLPVAAVLANREVDLLGQRALFAAKGHEQKPAGNVRREGGAGAEGEEQGEEGFHRDRVRRNEEFRFRHRCIANGPSDIAEPGNGS